MHPNAAISVAAAKNSERLTREIYGNEVIWTPWLRPGFELGLELQRICADHPGAKGVILGQHGLINWANDDKECYELKRCRRHDREGRGQLHRDRVREKGAATQKRLAGPRTERLTKSVAAKFLRRSCHGCAVRLASKGA